MRSHAVRLSLSHAALASTLIAALAIAACGDGAGAQGPGPQVPGTSPSGEHASTMAPPAASSVAPSASGSAAATPAGTAPAVMGPMKPIAASAMAEDLKKLGIDPLKPPPLNKLTPDTIRKLMPTFAKALGVKCAGCHDTNDFKAQTPKKRIAEKMWAEYVVGMQMDDGTPLYCDSCHSGHSEMLRRADKKEHSCEQCHGEPFEPKILEPWAKAK